MSGWTPYRRSAVHSAPHVAPFFQGITLTTDIQLDVKLTREQVVQRFQDMFGKEPLIEIVAQKDAVPVVKDNAQKHFVRLGGFAVDPATNRVVVVATLDNLLKGAATQALQNINIALGLRELDGIKSE
ncbi:hypothetical protein CAOG_02088 [Capsaspora owczarzaki ATCC 30864]|uniref:N-acetyl-gamma-glutamyl-phosphate reductase dimerisation domain-containing protein n=1 Tax=Capsaspora owczarzaki (strain ATCC 30864) TaxID=595528 RepID=A0A0D2U6Q0_CAPO3|nr:hypothetical protein CAOG_02088 [Capsaspora owczarzaki ATCC 30864]KJE90846.1 hypothetical protein CAOG_002088 [Capsaspora owczarzaki ATCC 30864]|eukprot:XP_004348838.1 hypothetical protein CAOG_02088 [Capsaspora owczarzaki ATCC 30864]